MEWKFYLLNQRESSDQCEYFSSYSCSISLSSVPANNVFICPYLHRLNCEEKHDIYDFGVILLEMIVGRTIIHPNDINISKDIVSAYIP